MGSAPDDRSADPAWIAYRAWLEAARPVAEDGAGTWPGLARELSRREVRRLTGDPAEAAELANATAKWVERSTGTAVRNWHQRPELPKEPVLLRALERVVPRLVPQPPPAAGQWTDFPELIEHLATRRRAGARSAARRRTASPDLPLRWGPGPAQDLDARELGLGSWAYDGDVPPYVPRDADDVIRERLSTPSGLTIVAGAPKAGKSRSVVEALRATCPDAVVWWVNSAPGVLPALVRLVERAVLGDGGNRDDELAARGLVVVLDDAHLCGVSPLDGLTDSALGRVARHARVVLTIHEHDLAEWRRQVLDRSTPGYDRGRSAVGATLGLVDLLDEHRVGLPSVLTDVELAGVRDALASSTSATRPDGRVELPTHVERWAEYLAAVDQLTGKAGAGRAAGGYRRAVLEAALDASHVYVPRVTAAQLRDLTRFHYRSIAPTRLWDDRTYDEALDWALTPIGSSGSPHALIQADHEPEGYRLLDSLQPRLDPSEGWRPDHLVGCRELSAAAMTRAGWIADDDTSVDWYRRAAADGSVFAVYNLGCVYESRGDLETAEGYYRQAAERGNADASNNLGSVLMALGRHDEAEPHFRRALPRQPLARVGLGRLLKRRGDTDQARRLFERARMTDATAALGHYELGLLDALAGETDAALAHFEATEPSFARDGMHRAAFRLRDGGDLTGGIEWLRHLWAVRDDDAYYDFVPTTLGEWCFEAGRLVESLDWLLLARETTPVPRTWSRLAQTAIGMGDLDLAAECYAAVRDAGEHAVGVCGLGHVRFLQGRPEEAEELVLAGLEHDRVGGDLDDDERGFAAALVAVIRVDRGDTAGAREILEIAPLLTPGKMALAGALLIDGEASAAMEIARELLDNHELDDLVRSGALCIQGGAHFEAGDLAAAERSLQMALDLGHPQAASYLSEIRAEWSRLGADEAAGSS